MYRNRSQNEKSDNEPFYRKGISLLVEQDHISKEKAQKVDNAIKQILLVKFTLLSKYRQSGKKKFLYSSKSSIYACYSQAEKAFNRVGISSKRELLNKYFEARMTLIEVISKVKELVLNKEIETEQLWESIKDNSVKKSQISDIIEISDWQSLVPLAIYSHSNTVLNKIVNKIGGDENYEYILRIISRNSFIKKDTINLLFFQN